MPFARPTLTALRNAAIQDITTSGIPGLDGLLRNAVLRVLAWCMSGLAYSVYGYLDWIARESVPFTATDEIPAKLPLNACADRAIYIRTPASQ